MKKHLLYISIGTNLPTAEQVLLWTKRKLSEAFRGNAYFSTPMKTEPINFPSSDPFTNQVVAIETTVPTKLANPLLKNLERQLGRTEEDVRRGIVRLDLDLMWMDGELLRPEQWELDYIKQGLEELRTQVPPWEQTPDEP
ncbi:MAG: 2-amino-4-hydroxy-6-hydroxymethyldihydropteridine diphosphokinase [Bacteroidaceae bacterium]|nr:2-amino-4-hydroxy-6-hydroxymethyldihydropteridine diphosphokinase [Bacteroidaceae bacterium]